MIFGTEVFVRTTDNGVYTASGPGTPVSGACIIVIAVHVLVFASIVFIAGVNGTGIVIIALNRTGNTAIMFIARVRSTSVIIITYNVSVDKSFFRITGSDITFITTRFFGRSMYTTNSWFTPIIGTFVMIITINCLRPTSIIDITSPFYTVTFNIFSPSTEVRNIVILAT